LAREHLHERYPNAIQKDEPIDRGVGPGMKIKTIGIDLAKNVFEVHEIDGRSVS
jgi:hypothetical protein